MLEVQLLVVAIATCQAEDISMRLSIHWNHLYLSQSRATIHKKVCTSLKVNANMIAIDVYSLVFKTLEIFVRQRN